MTIELEHLIAEMLALLLPFFRMGAFFMVAPIFGTQLVPARVRLVFAALLTVVVAPVLKLQGAPVVNLDTLFGLQVWLVAVQQVLVGVAMGLVFQMLFQIAVVGGQIVAMQSGLGFASLMDPDNGVSVAALGQLFLMTFTLLFLAINGHLLLVQVCVNSFTLMPVGHWLPPAGLEAMVLSASWLFMASLSLALPAVIALLVINIAFGVMSRAAPQLNIFAIGFPLTMVLGLFIVWLAMSGLFPNFQHYASQSVQHLQTILSQ